MAWHPEERKSHMTAQKSTVAAGAVAVGLGAILALVGPASAASADTVSERRDVRAVSIAHTATTAGFWHIAGFYPAKWYCEVERAAVSTIYPTDGCYFDPGGGWFFWWYTE
jgi:hypothetical protein